MRRARHNRPCNRLRREEIKGVRKNLYHLFAARGHSEFMGRKKKRGRPRIRTPEYYREYYRRKQREWRAAHPRIRTGRKQRKRAVTHRRVHKTATVRK